MMKRTAIALLALTVCVSGLAQPKGPRPASPGDKEKTDEKKEAPALNLTFSEGLFGAAQNEKTGTWKSRTACWNAASWR